MRYKSIEMKNYRSIGNDNCKLNFDLNIINLIGKNESGKSNIINAIKDVVLFENSQIIHIFNDINRHTNEPVEIIFELELGVSEIKERFPNYKGIDKDKLISKIKIREEAGRIIQEYDQIIIDIIASVNIDKFVEEIETSLSQLTPYMKQIGTQIGADPERAKKLRLEIDGLENIGNSFSVFSTPIINRIEKGDFRKLQTVNEKVKAFSSSVTKLKARNEKTFKDLSDMINPIYYYSDGDLEDEYTAKELIDAIKRNTTVGRLLNLVGVTEDDIIEWGSLKNGSKEDKEGALKEQFKESFSKHFFDLYEQEKIEIRLSFSDTTFRFYVYSDGRNMEFTSRSDGFRWYLNLYINLKAYNKKTLIVMDEPATGIHINAKKEILILLNDVVSKGNQILYTTHSPFMIDTERIGTVQLVTKNKGLTSIERNFYILKNKESKEGDLETLSPIIKSIGYDLQHDLAASNTKLNVIVEGITDYFYLDAMYRVLELRKKGKPNFLPCVGVSKENYIATILIGWGYEFVALLDRDKAGREEYKNLIEIILEDRDRLIIFNNECECGANDNITCSCQKTIEDMFSDDTIKQIEAVDKTLKAKEFHQKVLDDEIIVDELTKDNFRKLFERIIS